MENSKILLSVCMITYNQDRFIREAIEGVLNQKVNFNVEFIISDDCSTDSTKSIVDEYVVNHPNGYWIKYIRHEINLGMIENFISVLKICQGKYIALCDGDDFWTDYFKLYKQVSYLEENLNIVLCFHPVSVLMPNGKVVDDFLTIGECLPLETNIYDLATLGNYIHTPSVVFRNIIVDYPSFFFMSPIGDYFLYMLLSENGRIGKLSDNMAVYRFGIGVLSSDKKNNIDLKLLKTLFLIKDSLNSLAVKSIIEYRISKQYLNVLGIKIDSFSDVENFKKSVFLSKSFLISDFLLAIVIKIKRRIRSWFL